MIQWYSREQQLTSYVGNCYNNINIIILLYYNIIESGMIQWYSIEQQLTFFIFNKRNNLISHNLCYSCTFMVCEKLKKNFLL